MVALQPSWAQQPSASPQPALATASQPETLQAKLTRWYGLKDQIAALTSQEAALRREIFAQVFPKAPEKGTQRYGIGHGKDLKVTTKLNYSVDRAKLAEIGDNRLPQAVRDLVFRNKPEVVEGELAKALAPGSSLSPEVCAALAEVITSKPALPQLEIVDAKKGAA